jgi:exosortase A
MHGFLILPISLWLVFRDRRTLASMEPAPNPWLALGLVVCGFAWLLGQMAEVAPTAQFALIGILVLTVAAVLGPRISRAMSFPLAFLLFAVPFGEFFLPQLMQWTADFTIMGLRLSGVPVYRQGLQFVIPSGTWSVVEACSGVRYLIASLMLGTLFAYLSYRTLRRRLIFIGVSFVVPIVANWLRAYLIVILGHVSGNRLAVGADHLIYGWLFFGLVILIMFQIGVRWREDIGPEPVEKQEDSVSVPGNRHGLLAAALASAVLAALWPFLEWEIERGARPDVTRLETLGPVPGWAATEVSSDWTPQYLTASASLRQEYVKDGDEKTAGVFIGYYRNQGDGRKLVSSDNALVRNSDPRWKKTLSGAATIAINGSSFGVRTGELRTMADARLSVWQWYWVGGRQTSSDYLAKAYTAFDRLIGKGDDSAVVIVYTAVEKGDPDAVLRGFAATALPAIENVLRKARDD